MVAAFSSKIPPAVPTAQDARGTVATALLRPSRINPWRLFFGAMIPNWLLCRAEVGQGAKLCYARLMQYSGEGGRCYPKQKTLAPELGVSSRQVRGYLTELAQFGLIESEQHGLCRSNDYYFLDHPWIHEGQPAAQSASGQDGQSSSGQDRHESSAPSREEIHAKENHTKKNQVNVPPPQGGTVCRPKALLFLLRQKNCTRSIRSKSGNPPRFEPSSVRSPTTHLISSWTAPSSTPRPAIRPPSSPRTRVPGTIRRVLMTILPHGAEPLTPTANPRPQSSGPRSSAAAFPNSNRDPL
jgi:Helix-turn-helix domain